MQVSIKSSLKSRLDNPLQRNQFKNDAKAVLAGLFAIGLFLSASSEASAQVTQLEHSSSSYSGTIPNGPSLSPVKARFVNNTTGNTFTTFNPEINVTASFSDQQYTNSAGTSVKTGNFFGGTINNGQKQVVAQTVWRNLNSISSPSNNLFTSNPNGTAGQGLSVTDNYGFNMFTSVEPLYEASKSLTGRYYYSKLTITFNRAVSNPVLHIVGLGAFTTISKNNTDYTHGFATELELFDPTSGITLTKLSGSSALTVSNNKITNNKTTIDDQSNDGAATGSIRVTGNNITTLVFKVYLRGDSHGSAWSASKLFAGDQWLMAFSMNASSISGNIFDDGNALTDSKVNPIPNNDGDGTNAGGTLYVNLVNSSNQIVATATVAEDGGYVFQDIVSPSYPTTYKLVLTTDKTKTTPSLPTGWVNTGEFLGAPTTNGNDLTVDGILPNITLTNATTSITNANFGIEKKPVSDSKTLATQVNPGGSTKVTVPTLTGTDLEDGSYTGSSVTNTIKITSLPNSANGILYYNDSPVTLNQVISNYDPSKLKVDPTDGNQTVVFTYSHKDAAGQFSDPATVTMPFYPVYTVSGNVFDDANGLSASDNKVNGAPVKGSDIDSEVSGAQPVFVTLSNGSTYSQTVQVGENGAYSFSNVPVGSYTVILQTSGLSGSTSASLPSNWVNTGENKGLPTATGSDGMVDGKLSFSVNTSNVDNLNLAIDKIPVSFAKTATNVPNPGGSTQVTVPTLTGKDLEDGDYNGTSLTNTIKIVTLPSSSTGDLYYNGTLVTLGQVIDSYDPSKLKVDPKDGPQVVSFTYSNKDAAGQYSIPALVTIPFSASLYTVSGNVFDDANGLTASDGKVNGTPVIGSDIDSEESGAQPVFITLSNGSSYMQTVQVGDNGAYSFGNVPADNYTVTLHTAGLSGSSMASLPDNWVNTGENKDLPTVPGNDGTANGKLSFTVTNASVDNLNLAIDKIPVSYAKTESIQANPGGSIQVTVPTLTGKDLEDGSYDGVSLTNTIKIVTLPSSATGDLYYNGSLVTIGQVIESYDPSKLKVDPRDGAQVMTFTYSHKDAAGQLSTPVSVTMPFSPTLYTVSGNVFDDANGLTSPGNTVDGAGVKGSDIDSEVTGTQPVFITLSNGSSYSQTVQVNENGTYSFSNVPADSYTVTLQSEGLTGTTTASLPPYWKNTGENKGTGAGNDGTIDGQLSFTISNANVDDLNLGIDKLSIADDKSKTISKPTGDVTLDGKGNNPPALTGTDLEDGTLGGDGSMIIITSLPNNGELYYNGVLINTLNTIIDNNFVASKLTFKFTGSGYNSIEFEYAFVDKAGITGIPATYGLNWTAPLPVTLANFTARKSEQSSILDWVTTSETNSDHFDIQHSTDGKNWIVVGTVQANNSGKTNSKYSFTHTAPASGDNLYRLQMVDIDETFAYSRIVSLHFDGNIQTAVYPNPATDYVKILVDGQLDMSKLKDVKVYDLNGRVVLTPSLTSDMIDVQKLNVGLYMMQVTRTNGTVSMLKISVVK